VALVFLLKFFRKNQFIFREKFQNEDHRFPAATIADTPVKTTLTQRMTSVAFEAVNVVADTFDTVKFVPSSFEFKNIDCVRKTRPTMLTNDTTARTIWKIILYLLLMFAILVIYNYIIKKKIKKNNKFIKKNKYDHDFSFADQARFL